MSKLLYNSSEVRKHITSLFSSEGRRVAISAFVGDGAESYLGKGKGVHLICWPRAGGTNPNALRMLVKRGVKVSFVDSLHMKVYWAEGMGAIVTSANLSTNALGAGNLKEIGVLLPKGALDIDRLIGSLRIRAITGAELKKLDRLHKQYVVRNRADFPRISKSQSFEEWYASPHRVEWKLGWWNWFRYGASASVGKIARDEHDVREPHYTQECDPGYWKNDDWVLSFRLNKNGVGEVKWMYINFVATLTKAERRSGGYACEAAQLWPPKAYSERPFHLDQRFRKAFDAAVQDYGIEKIEGLKTAKPPTRLIELIHDNLTLA